MLKAGYFSAPLVDALFVLNLRLDVCNSVTGFHLEGNCLAREGLYENLHTCSSVRKNFKRS